jgi:hypothetical protein
LRRRVAASSARSGAPRSADAKGSGLLQTLVHEQYVAASVMKETMRILPPHFSQISGSVLNTRRIKFAHRRRRTLRFVALNSPSLSAGRFFGALFFVVGHSVRSSGYV